MIPVIFMCLIRSFVDLSGHYVCICTNRVADGTTISECIDILITTIIIYIKKKHDVVNIKKSWNGKTKA